MRKPTNAGISRREALRLLSATALSGLASSCQSNKVPAAQPFRFVVASDGHFGEANTPFEQYYDDLIAAINGQHKKTPLHFAVINGDLVHRDSAALLPKVKTYLDRLRMPYYVTRGNHDRVSVEQWKTIWGYPTNHAVDTEAAGLILLDTSNENGEYTCGDALWLDNALGRFKPGKPLFIFMHIPYYRGLSEDDICQDLHAVINHYPMVRAIFHGHDHGKDMGLILNEKALLFDGRFGSSWGTGYRGFRMVEQTSPDKFTTHQYDFVNHRIINTLNF